MALSATIYKLLLNVSDMDRCVYADFPLTLACHPSETESRMMIRVWAFIQNADPALTFTKGLSTDSEPDLWQKSLDGRIEKWIEVGLPDADRLRKASRIADSVTVYAYGQRTAPLWWQKQQRDIQGLSNVQVFYLPPDTVEALSHFAKRTMNLSAVLQDGQLMLSDEHNHHTLEQQCWQGVADV